MQLFDLHNNVDELKQYCRAHKLRVSGKKKDLIDRTNQHIHLNNMAIRIQAIWRGTCCRIELKCGGPALHNRTICTNEIDFSTLESVHDIPRDQFLSYTDPKGFVYGFDILSLYGLFKDMQINWRTYTKRTVKNPFDRITIPTQIVKNSLRLIKKRKPIIYAFQLGDGGFKQMSQQRQLEQITIEIFQEINLLGNYAEYSWLYQLSPHSLRAFINELVDVFEYRVFISNDVKISIIPPNGIFLSLPEHRSINEHLMQAMLLLDHGNEQDRIDGNLIYQQQYKTILNLVRKLIRKGIDRSHRCLGVSYFLGALTLVSTDAANALPWLYDCFYR